MFDKEFEYQQKNVNQCGYPYKFSVIMAVYNVEAYLQDAIESIINQSIGFIENVQLILINDGSSDLSGQICEIYKSRYPENIYTIHQSNTGLPSARKIGVAHASGKYFSFLDADDKLSGGTLKQVYQFFESHYDEIDLVCIPIYYFGNQSGQHNLNSKFAKGDRIIYLTSDYNNIHFSIASSFIKNHQLVSLEFEERLSIAEDARTIVKLLLNKRAFGVITGCRYFYRIRSDGSTSLIQSASNNPDAYLPVLRYFIFWAINYCIKNFGYIPWFVQCDILYEMKWRLSGKSLPTNILSTNEIKEYCKLLYDAVKYIDDKILMENKLINIETKKFILTKKYNRNLERNFTVNDCFYFIHNTGIFYASKLLTKIDFINIKSGNLIIEGVTYLFLESNEKADVYAEVNGRLFLCQKTERTENRIINGEVVSSALPFIAFIPLGQLKNDLSINFICMVGNHTIIKKYLVFGPYSPIGKEFKNSYWIKDNWKVTVNGYSILIETVKKSDKLLCELKFLKELWSTNSISNRKAVLARICYHILKFFHKKRIWLISDKANRADDNGEALFKYINTKRITNLKVYFVIGKNYPDYFRIKKIGSVIAHLSYIHKIVFLISETVISAYTHNEMFNPFQEYSTPYRDISSQKKRIFLQHGITHNDISNGINRYTKNLTLIISAANEEYNYFLTQPFHYNKENIALTGFPRFDLLSNKETKIIVVAPTWRRYLFSNFVSKENRWVLKNGLENSDFFQFYYKLLNDKALLDAAKKTGYKIYFVPHSVFFPYIDHFFINPDIEVCGTEINYRDIISHSSVLITDYSSVAFDFAYLHKPVIYAQFDKDKFYALHGYNSGYFDYEKNGFGPVCYDYKTTIQTIVDCLKSSCKFDEKYDKRRNNFFRYDDKNNCERTFNEILKL